LAKILVVEDETDIRGNLARFLRLEGHAVVEAVDGIDGVATAQSEKPDLILCDISMPGLNGYEVLEKLRASPETHGIPFVFVSASVEPGKQARGVEMGAKAYVTKPFNLAAMRELIKSLTEKA
jgi:CheY-like chemotaxis protein